jgi:hypothetical protein
MTRQSSAVGAQEGPAGLRAQLEAWAEELDAWVQRHQGLLLLLDLVTRDRPNSEPLAAVHRQVRAVLEQTKAMGQQLRAMRQQLETIEWAAGESEPA